MYTGVASSPDLPRLLIAASDLKEGRPGRFWYVTLRQVDTNVTSCQPTVTRFSYSVALASTALTNDSLVTAPSVPAACDVSRVVLADGWLARSYVRDYLT